MRFMTAFTILVLFWSWKEVKKTERAREQIKNYRDFKRKRVQKFLEEIDGKRRSLGIPSGKGSNSASV